MDTKNNILSSLKAEKGQLTLNLKLKSMIDSKSKNESDNHLVIRNRSVRIIVGQINNGSFSFQFATTFVEPIEINIEFGNQEKIELDLEWTDRQYTIRKNNTIISENRNLPGKSPGGSIQLDIKAMVNEKNDFQYIIDIGERDELNKERISLFIDKEFSLTLRIFDKKGNEFSVKQIKSKFWKPDNLLRVICAWNQKTIKIRTFNKSNDIDFVENKIKYQGTNLFYMPINPPMIIGTDLMEKYFSKMTLSELNLYDIPII